MCSISIYLRQLRAVNRQVIINPTIESRRVNRPRKRNRGGERFTISTNDSQGILVFLLVARHVLRDRRRDIRAVFLRRIVLVLDDASRNKFDRKGVYHWSEDSRHEKSFIREYRGVARFMISSKVEIDKRKEAEETRCVCCREQLFIV